MVGQCHPGTRCKIRAIAFTKGRADVTAQGLKPGFSERPTTGVLFKAARVVVVLVVRPVEDLVASLFMHQGVSRVFEGVILHRDRSGAHPLPIRKPEHTGPSGTPSCFSVVWGSLKPGRIAMMIGKNQCRWLLAIQAFLRSQAFDKGQIAFPVLDAVFPLLRTAFKVEDGIDDPSLLQQSTHNLIRAPVLENTAVVHQRQAPGRWPKHQFVVGTSMAGISTGEFADYTGKTTQWHLILPDHQVHRLLQHIRGDNRRIGTGQVNTSLKQLGQSFCQRKANNGKVIRGEFAYGGGELQSACLGHVFGP